VSFFACENASEKVQKWPESFSFRVIEGTNVGEVAQFHVSTDINVKRITLFRNDGKIEEVHGIKTLTCEEWHLLSNNYNYYAEVEKYRSSNTEEHGKIFRSKPINVTFSGVPEDLSPIFLSSYFHSRDLEVNSKKVWLGWDVNMDFVIRDVGKGAGIHVVRLFNCIKQENGSTFLDQIDEEYINVHWTENKRTTEFFRLIAKSPEEPGKYVFLVEAEDWNGNKTESDKIEITWKKYYGVIM